MVERIGQYTLVGNLTRAPGACLADAESSDGERVLLQFAILRAASSEEDKGERLRAERSAAQATAALISDPDVIVKSHGSADADGAAGSGRRVLFWALPRPWAPLVLQEGHRLSAEGLLDIADALARRMVRRHKRGGREPTMCEHAVWLGAGRAVHLAGVPVFLPARWLDSETPPCRLAPEELEPTAAGDVWRLGQTLLGLTDQSNPLPPGVQRCIELLCAAEPGARTPTSDAAVESIALAKLELERSLQLSSTKEMRAPKNGRQSQPVQPTLPKPEAEIATSFMRTRSPISPTTEEIKAERADLPWAEAVVIVADLDETPAAPPSTPAPAPALAKALAVPMSPASEGPSEAGIARPSPAIVLAPPAVVLPAAPLVPAAVATLAGEPDAPLAEPAAFSVADTTDRETEVPDRAARIAGASLLPSPAGSAKLPSFPSFGAKPLTLLFGDPSEAHTSVEAPKTAELLTPRLADEAAAAAWAAPVIPTNASPWSDVVHPRGMKTLLETSDFTGFVGPLPDHVPSPLPVEVKPIQAPAPPLVIEGSNVDAEVSLALSGFNTKKIAIGVVAFFALLGLFALLSRPSQTPIAALDALVATPAHEFLLSSTPRTANVLSEADGRLLGVTPLHFLVPPNAEAAVILTAPGFEPQRAVLAERGAITVSLTRLQPSVRCTLEIDAGGIELEGVGFDLSNPKSETIPGAVVLRAKSGQSRAGARVVRCPELGGERKVALRLNVSSAPAALRITHPAGASAFLNGDPVGVVPTLTRTSYAFSLIRVMDPAGLSEERWVPSTTDSEVQLPAPQPRTVSVQVPDPFEPPSEARSDLKPQVGSPPAPVALNRSAELPQMAPKTSAEPVAADASDPSPSSVEDRKAKARNLHRLGSKHLISGDLKRARTTLLQCLKIDPTAGGCHVALGTLYRRQGDSRRARQHFERYLEIDPEATDAHTIRRIMKTLP